jgi:hypothetical protein
MHDLIVYGITMLVSDTLAGCGEKRTMENRQILCYNLQVHQHETLRAVFLNRGGRESGRKAEKPAGCSGKQLRLPFWKGGYNENLIFAFRIISTFPFHCCYRVVRS